MKSTNKTIVSLKRSEAPLLVGQNQPTRVNTLLGISDASKESDEYKKLEALLKLENDMPEIVTDLSIIPGRKCNRLWEKVVKETNFVAATVPIYLAHRYNGKIDRHELLDIATEQMESGVGLITIHPTATRKLLTLAKKRLIPFTSRGGTLVIADIVAREKLKEDNVYLDILDDLISVARRTSTVISIGTSFRPATIFDAMDDVHREEIVIQHQIAERIMDAGVGVIIEGPGHCRPKHIRQVASLFRKTGLPVMTLGPLPIDSGVEQDHIISAIGATLLGLEDCADILSIVTREEHTGGIPSINSILEAVKAAKVAARIIDLETIQDEKKEYLISKLRADSKSCIAGNSSPGCSRCASICPLKLLTRINEIQ
jgi:phosphomethylpyrimidine synthase